MRVGSNFAYFKENSQSLAEEVASKLTPQGYLRKIHAAIWRKRFTGRRQNECKGPEAVVHLKNYKEGVQLEWFE